MQGSKRDTDVKNRLLDSVGEGKGGMISENSIETCVLPYVKQMTSASSMHKAGHSSRYSDAGRDWGQEEKGTKEDEMAGWHHQLNGREFE